MLDNASYSAAQRVGTRLGTTLSALLKKTSWTPVSRVFFYSKPLNLPFKPWSRLPVQELRRLHERYYRQAHAVQGLDLDLDAKRELQDKYLTSFYLYEYFSRNAKPPVNALQAIRFGDYALLLGIPASCASETGRKLRGLPGKLDLNISDNCGSPLFPIIPADQYNGGYACNRSFYASDADEELCKSAGVLVKAVQPLSP
jgi:hypothetical protein